ncbi:MAG: hypothetical protein AAGA90_22100 [Actinomycetota bacterium]
MITHIRLHRFAAAIMLGLLLAACGGGDDDTDAQPASEVASGADTTDEPTASTTTQAPAGETDADATADPVDLPPFGTPPEVAVSTNGVDEVAISWQEVADAKGYAIHRDFEFLTWVPAGTSAYLDTEVTAGQEYRYHVRAQDSADVYTEPTKGQRVVVEPPDLVAPSTPDAASVALDDDGAAVVLTWSAATDDVAVTGYLVHRNEEFVAFVVDGALTFTDTEVEPGTGYLYEIRAQDPSGNNSEPTIPVAVQVP